MKPPTETQAVSKIVELLSHLLGSPSTEVEVQHVGGADYRYDFAIRVNGRRFTAEYKSHSSTVAVVAAISGLQHAVETSAIGSLPLIIVPFMGPVGRELCEKSTVSWIDLCGNAKIVAPGLRIWIEGRPNEYSERGRPPNVFAPKSSRIARQLLLCPKKFQTQATLARQTGLADGYVSKIVRRLAQEQYVDTTDDGKVRPRDANLLLDSWHDVYDFDHHRVIKGHVPARTGVELLQRVTGELIREEQEWAVTGLCAAWLYTSFAAFRLVTVYLSSIPTRNLLKQIEFSDEPRGANLWLVIPDDEGVFHGGLERDSIPCVSPLQTYLDLKKHPERAKDAAVNLRTTLLSWGQHAT